MAKTKACHVFVGYLEELEACNYLKLQSLSLYVVLHMNVSDLDKIRF